MRNRLVKKWKSHSGHFCTIFYPTYFSVEVNFTFCKNLILDHPRWKNPEKIQKIFKKLHRAWLVKTKSSEYFTFQKIQNLKKNIWFWPEWINKCDCFSQARLAKLPNSFRSFWILFPSNKLCDVIRSLIWTLSITCDGIGQYTIRYAINRIYLKSVVNSD